MWIIIAIPAAIAIGVYMGYWWGHSVAYRYSDLDKEKLEVVKRVKRAKKEKPLMGVLEMNHC